MNEFVIAYPSIVLWLVGLLFGAVSSLIAGLLYFVKISLDGLSKSVDNLTKSLEERKNDISILANRMQKLETTCEMQRASCPIHGRPA